MENKMITAAILILLATAFCGPAVGASMPINDKTCSSFISVYCSSCHNNQRICQGLKTFDEKKWQATIKTMAGYAELDKEDQENTMACVTFMKPENAAVCK